ncbi:3-methyl-2-oxobutanoate hydroxymethyltransferase [Chloroflexota bacterium]
MSTKVTPNTLLKMKQNGEKIIFMPVYDFPFASILEDCRVDMFLVGDSLSTTMLGKKDDSYCTMEEMIIHTQAVARAAERAMVVADMPFMSYQVNIDEAKKNAGRLIKEGGADAVKLEGGIEIAETVRALVVAGIPVMGHIGLIDQALRLTGVRRVRGRTEEDRQRLIEDAKVLEEAGLFQLGLVFMTVEIAREITQMLKIPTNGIGSGPYCDGNSLNIYDIIGLSPSGFAPKFVKQYVNVREIITGAVNQFINEVREGKFPDDEHSYH